MKEEVINYLKAKEGGVFLDCTLGGAGHTKAILDANKNNIGTIIPAIFILPFHNLIQKIL